MTYSAYALSFGHALLLAWVVGFKGDPDAVLALPPPMLAVIIGVHALAVSGIAAGVVMWYQIMRTVYLEERRMGIKKSHPGNILAIGLVPVFGIFLIFLLPQILVDRLARLETLSTIS